MRLYPGCLQQECVVVGRIESFKLQEGNFLLAEHVRRVVVVIVVTAAAITAIHNKIGCDCFFPSVVV